MCLCSKFKRAEDAFASEAYDPVYGARPLKRFIQKLLSYVNMKLRNFYSNLDALCDDMGVSKTEIEEKLSAIGYYYQEAKNQFTG